MATVEQHRVDWKLLWEQRAFRYFFTAMFVSLFGSGMNFIGVSWYIMSATHSTVAVSWQVIVVTLPGLVVPFLGGVLIDRFDRRYLGALLDLARGFAVLGDCLCRVARATGDLAPVPNDADYRHGLSDVLGQRERAGAGSDSPQPIYGWERRGIGWGADRACCWRVRLLDLSTTTSGSRGFCLSMG